MVEGVMEHDAKRLAQDLQAVLDTARAMASERNLDRLLGLIVKSVTQVVGADRTSLFLVDRDKHELVTRVSQGAREIRVPLGSGIAGTVAATGTPINIPHAYADPRFNRDSDRTTGYITRSILCLPLTNYSGEVVGVIQALNKRGGEPFGAYDEQVLSALCGSAAVAIDNAQLIARDRERQRLENELDLARKIQLGLLPSAPPTLPGWRIASFCRSCDQTGGDYVDFIPCGDGRLDVVVGDVSGHGIAAALLMSTARAFLRALLERGESPAATMHSLNRLLEADLSDDSFMTMVLARLAGDGSCGFVAAGHEPPLVWRRGGARDGLTSGGLPLGMLDDSTYDEGVIAPLAPGDLLVLFTDGITDVHAPPDNVPWGMDNLRATVAAHAGGGAQVVCDAVVAAATAHLAGAHPHDDMTLVVVERLPT
jgi:serine phosphatase RsbU (regulator of sigma subunit)/putative methionine-R-sulfoxide reductase with GAF domain